MILIDKFGLHGDTVNTLEVYSSLILRWNQHIQMTATRDQEEFMERHIVDSLELASDIPAGPARMLDVGSGGGLPGIVLAIVRPEIQFTLIEPTQKKHAFLSTARRELSLANVVTLAIRDEELLRRDDFQPFDYAVARAVWDVETWLQRGRSLVRSEGLIFAMEGRDETDLPKGARRRRYQLAEGRQRSIVRLTASKTEPA